MRIIGKGGKWSRLRLVCHLLTHTHTHIHTYIRSIQIHTSGAYKRKYLLSAWYISLPIMLVTYIQISRSGRTQSGLVYTYMYMYIHTFKYTYIHTYTVTTQYLYTLCTIQGRYLLGRHSRFKQQRYICSGFSDFYAFDSVCMHVCICVGAYVYVLHVYWMSASLPACLALIT